MNFNYGCKHSSGGHFFLHFYDIKVVLFQGKPKDYCNMTMPSGCGHGLYSPVRPNEGVIYAKVDQGKENRRQQDLNFLNTSSYSSVREGESDSISVEIPFVTSEDGKSPSNSEDCKFIEIRTITYDDRESQV
jgi:hypothetical protein